jgi:hypothetical protein
MRIVIGLLFGLLGFVFATIAGTAVGVLVTRTYRLQMSPVIAFSIFSVLALGSFVVARKLIWHRKARN